MEVRHELRGLQVLADALRDAIVLALAGDDAIARASDLIASRLLAGYKVLACGNGGSAADAQHFVAELVGRFSAKSKRPPLPAISLSSDPSVLTCIANDYGYEEVFARQVSAHGRPGDVLLAISTSGLSSNVIEAARRARSIGMHVVGMSGRPALSAVGPGSLRAHCDVLVSVPSDETRTIQEVHGAILHSFCENIERSYL